MRVINFYVPQSILLVSLLSALKSCTSLSLAFWYSCQNCHLPNRVIVALSLKCSLHLHVFLSRSVLASSRGSFHCAQSCPNGVRIKPPCEYQIDFGTKQAQ